VLIDHFLRQRSLGVGPTPGPSIPPGD